MKEETKRTELSKVKAEAWLGAPLPDPAPTVKEKGKPPRKKKYITPEELFIHFQAYRVKEKADPYKVNGFIGGKFGAEEVMFTKERPLTMEGFQVYLMTEGIIMGIHHILANSDGRYGAYVSTIEAIKTFIKHDQVSGAAAGVFQPNIIARLQGLAEKTENKNINLNSSFDLEMDLS